MISNIEQTGSTFLEGSLYLQSPLFEHMVPDGTNREEVEETKKEEEEVEEAKKEEEEEEGKRKGKQSERVKKKSTE